MARVMVSKKTMEAIRVRAFGAPDVLQLESNVEIPEVGAKQVLVKLSAAGINPVETYIRTGTHAMRPNLPYTPGGDGAGTVEAVGSEVSRFRRRISDARERRKVGDRVFTAFHSSGTYAGYVVADAGRVFTLADRLTFAQGACIGVPYFTAYRALFHKSPPSLNETVLIHGASGGCGQAAIQLAVAKGLTVYGTAGTPQGLKAVLRNGAHKAFCHRDADYMQAIKSATNDRGVDVIVEMLANVNLNNDLQLLAQNGRVKVVGNRGTIEINPRLTMQKEVSIIGVGLPAATEADWQQMGQAIQDGIQEGYINPIISKEYALADAAQAHRDIIESSGATGKLVFKIEHH